MFAKAMVSRDLGLDDRWLRYEFIASAWLSPTSISLLLMLWRPLLRLGS